MSSVCWIADTGRSIQVDGPLPALFAHPGDLTRIIQPWVEVVPLVVGDLMNGAAAPLIDLPVRAIPTLPGYLTGVVERFVPRKGSPRRAMVGQQVDLEAIPEPDLSRPHQRPDHLVAVVQTGQGVEVAGADRPGHPTVPEL